MKGTSPKYLVSADFDTIPEIPVNCEWVSPNADWTLFTDLNNIITEEGNLTWCNFSSSLAVNFAILRGYKEIYLAGIDLIEDGKPLVHYDGIVNKDNTAKFRCKDEKEFIKKICKLNKVLIYNVNPKCDWLKVKDIGIIK